MIKLSFALNLVKTFLLCLQSKSRNKTVKHNLLWLYIY